MPIEQNDRFARLSRIPVSACAPYAVLIVAVLVAYSNVYHNDFLFDDIPLIRDNKFLTSWHYFGTLFVTQTTQGGGVVGPFYRPLQLLLYFFIYQAFGLSTIAFHLLNVTLHSLNACLLYVLGIRLGFQRIAVLLAALLWAIHPVQTEAVTFMSGTPEPLCGAFLLSGILVLVPDFRRRHIPASCLLFAMALLSKETAVVFPLLAMGLLFYRSENRWSLRTYLQTWPFWLTTAIYFLARETVLNFNGFLGFYNTGVIATETIWDRFYTFLATLPAYLRLLVWPTGLHFRISANAYFLDTVPVYKVLLIPDIAAGLALLAVAFTIIVWKPARPATPLAWGLLWASALHAPQSSILAPANTILFEHWMYLPTMGLALGVGESVARLSGHLGSPRLRVVLAGLSVLTACVFGAMTFEQNKVWRDVIVLYKNIFTYDEVPADAHNRLGVAYQEKGQYALAAEQFRIALALDDHDAKIHYNLALALLYLDLGKPSFDEAMKQLQYTIDLDPDYYRVYDTLAAICVSHGNLAGEAEYRAKSAAIKHKLGMD